MMLPLVWPFSYVRKSIRSKICIRKDQSDTKNSDAKVYRVGQPNLPFIQTIQIRVIWGRMEWEFYQVLNMSSSFKYVIMWPPMNITEQFYRNLANLSWEYLKSNFLIAWLFWGHVGSGRPTLQTLTSLFFVRILNLSSF